MVIGPSEDGSDAEEMHYVSTCTADIAIDSSKGSESEAGGSVNCELGFGETNYEGMPL